MPTTSNAKKRLRQSEKHRALNRSRRSALRTQIRKVRVAAEAGKFDEAGTEFRLATKRLDQAAAGNLIHRNTAARLKSRLSALIKKSQQAATA